MADTFSSLLEFRLQQTGANDNTWGELLNDVIEAIENAITGMTSHAVTGGALDLSADPLAYGVHKFTGTLSSDLTVTIPNTVRKVRIWNATAGAFYMLVKTSAGTAVCIPQGTFKDIVCDGANGVYRMDREDVGKIEWFGGTTVPSGFFECDGATPSRTLTPDLFAKISTTWGVGNGATTYTLPDMKTAGRFIRARTGSVAVGTYQAADIAAHNHALTSASIASSGAHTHTGTTDTTGSGHGHTVTVSDTRAWGFSRALLNNVASGGTDGATGQSGAFNIAVTVTSGSISASTDGTDGTHTHTFSISSSGAHTHTLTGTTDNSTGTETRPINAVMMAVIRY
jgi:microcystin-dependent protein